MLKKLEIQNYAIIEKLEMTFSDGLTIITGETGAGKSILLGALGLIMGKRADTKVLFNYDKKCFVEATFEISGYEMKSFLDEEGLDYFNEMIVRREIASNGKSRAFINDSPVTLEILSSITNNLIDIHQQFDTLDIQKSSFQLKMIDAVAGNQHILIHYTNEYTQYKTALNEIEYLRLKSKNANQEMEFLSFQKSEFEDANLKENEQTELESQLLRLTAAEDIKKNSSMLVQGIEEDHYAVLGQLQVLTNQIGTIRQFDIKIDNIFQRLLSVKEELSDISREATRIADSTEYDEEAIHITNARLNLIYRLQKKHHVSDMTSLLDISKTIKYRLESYGDLSEQIAELERKILLKENELRILSGKLSENRKKILPSFEKDIHNKLMTLAMDHAFIQVKCTSNDFFNPTGTDEISILFAPNKGSAFLPLKDTASGGELSRLALCIKSQVAGAITLPTLVFDEIDSGVSGEVAHKMGKILSEMSDVHQVICITHSPQIAARADSHYFVYKTNTDIRTITSMKQLSEEERVMEIAKMLSGNPPTETAKANAKELLSLQ